MQTESSRRPDSQRRTRNWSTLAAVAVAVILLGTVVVNFEGTRTSANTSTTPSASADTASSSSSSAASPGPLEGACAGHGASPALPDGSEGSAAPRTEGTAPGPLFNSAMQPYASFTGPYSYVARGAALRDQGYGKINLTWEGGSTTNLVAAYMIWAILNNTVPQDNATLNGHAVVGTWTAYATPSPCWAPTYVFTFVADVTSDIVNGLNVVTGVPSNITTGADPWTSNEVGPLDEGASLVAIFHNGTILHQVTVYSGALPIGGAAPPLQTSQLNYSRTNSSTATSTYIVADGQLPDNSAWWNGTDVDANAFYGSDPHESAQTWEYGNLSDTRTLNLLPVELGSNNTTASVESDGDDCLSWVGQVLSVGVAASKGPYSVRFIEQGLPSGTEWNVTTDLTTQHGDAGASPSSLTFELGNGTYTYSVSALAGFETSPSEGSYAVAGGNITIRLIFHALVYPLEFVETGLPQASDWWVLLTNTSQALSDNVTAYSPYGAWYNESNGTYHFITGEVGLYLPDTGSGSVTISGSAVVVTIVFRPPPLYPVTFREQNLTAGTTWGGYVGSNWGTFDNSTSASSFTVDLPNATQSSDYITPFDVSGYTHVADLYYGVFGAPETVDVNYSLVYGVRLVETGLPSGTLWYAYIAGNDFSEYGDSSNGTIYSALENGSYIFQIQPIYAYVASPITGSFIVDGANVTVDITFRLSPTYAITFVETGLSAGTNWSVVLDLPDDNTSVAYSTGTEVTFQMPNGSYIFYPKAAGWQANLTYGYVSIAGGPQTIDLLFVKVYTVTFVESGLPTGLDWEIYYDYQSQYAGTSSLVFSVPDGSYMFTPYSTASYTPTPDTATWLNVTGANLTQPIVFTSLTAPTYSVTFTETGLAAGTNWSVEVSLYDATLWSLTDSIVFFEANGTIDFAVPTVGAQTPSPASGTVNVTGANASQAIVFGAPPATYPVMFTESGLPNLADWYINITGEPGLWAVIAGSSGTELGTSLSDGSYTYTATSDLAGWTALGGTFQVQNAAVNVSVPFTNALAKKFLVTFEEKGLPDGAKWFVNVSGAPLSAIVAVSGGTTVTLLLINGSYSYTASSGWSNWTTTSPVKFSVSGANETIAVTYTSNSGSTGSSSPGSPWLWIGIGAAALVAALLLILLAASRRRKKDPPQQQPPPVAPEAGTPPPPPPPGPG